mgnify:CR=1 FL=1
MKARENNGIITIFRSLPESWDGSSGHIVNFRNASTEVLESEGFFDVVKPSYDSRIEELGEIEFDSENNYYTYPKSDKTISETLAELKAQKKQAVKFFLAEPTDQCKPGPLHQSYSGSHTSQSDSRLLQSHA